MAEISTYIHTYNCVTPLGYTVEENWQNLQQGKSGIRKHSINEASDEIYLSKIDDGLLEQKFQSIIGAEGFTRLEKMILLSLQPVLEQHPATGNSVLILSTTKGNNGDLKNQENPPQSTFLHQTARKISEYLGLESNPVVISNACVSGVMAISVAKNMIQAGMYDHAYVFAGDEVSEFVVSGFNSFQAMSAEPCRPYDKNRDGITLGEAAAAVFVSKNAGESASFKVLGESAVNDANHISGPSRTGEGLYRSIQNALGEAKISANEIDFLSAHGTATVYNDEMESIAFTRAELQIVPVNCLKGFYGHTLGAAGLLETVIAMESAKNNFLIGSANLEQAGVSQEINIIRRNDSKQITTILKTASGFGGCNAALVLQKTS